MTLGLQLWGGLAADRWSPGAGLKIAFSGTFEPWAIVQTRDRDRDPPHAAPLLHRPDPRAWGFTFPAMVAGGGIWLQNLFISDVVSAGYTEMTALVQAYAARLGSGVVGREPAVDHDGGRERALLLVRHAGDGRARSCSVLLALFCITYAQVIWGAGRASPS